MRILLSLVLLSLAAFLPAADLSKVDRSIGKEPAYRGKPKYCLLVFGEQAATKIWLVDDGERIFVDRNADGDLTEAGEMIKPSERKEFQTIQDGQPAPYRTLVFKVESLSPGDKSGMHTDFSLTRYRIGKEPANYVISVKVNGKVKQYAGWDPLFQESRERAPIIHFGGPLITKAIRYKQISLKAKNPELHLGFGTPGVGKGAFGYIAYEAVPKKIQPVAEIQWPGEGDGLVTKVPMLSRC